jgi:hypothetical protein
MIEPSESRGRSLLSSCSLQQAGAGGNLVALFGGAIASKPTTAGMSLSSEQRRTGLDEQRDLLGEYGGVKCALLDNHGQEKSPVVDTLGIANDRQDGSAIATISNVNNARQKRITNPLKQ